MISLRTAINSLGYGVVGFNILKGLTEQSKDVCYWPIGQPDIAQEHHELLQRCVALQNTFEPTSPHLTIWHEHALHERIGKGINCGMSFFELDTFQSRTKQSIQCQDIFLVASSWARDIANKEVPNQDVRIIDIGVNSDYFRPMKINGERPYRFLNVGKIEIRKGHDILVDLFNKAFTQEDDVELYISWDNPFLQEHDKKRWVNLYKDSPLGNKIHFVPRQQDIRNEYWAADCCIFPTRAEAICLPILESMACDKPVITTNYSGQTAFCNTDNSFLVDIDELEPARDGIWFHGDGNWAKIGAAQEAQFIEHMRHCYKNRINTNLEGRKTAERLTWNNTVKQILGVFNE